MSSSYNRREMTMLKFFYSILAGVIFLSPLITAYSAEKNLQEFPCIVLDDWPKQYQTNEETGEIEGFAIDVMNKVAEIAGIKIRYLIAQNWSEAIKLSKRYDTLIFPNMGISDDRLRLYDYTQSYETIDISVFLRKASPCIDSLSDLSGKRIGGVETNIGADLIGAKGGSDIHVYISVEEMIMGLLSGDVDAIIYPSGPLLNIASRSGLEDKIKKCLGPIKEVKRAIAISKGNPALFTKIDAALLQLMNSDEYKNIYEKWYGKPNPFWNMSRLLILTGIVFMFTLFAALLWRHRMILRSNQFQSETIARLKQAEQALSDSEIHHRTLIHAIPDLIWLKDLDGVYLSCNPTFERFFGAKESEIIGKTDYDFVDKDLADSFRKHDKNALMAGEPKINEETITFAADGYCGRFETIKAPMPDTEGKLIGVIGIARDITERKSVEDGLKESEKRLKSAQRIGKVGNWEYDIATQKFWGSEQAKLIFGLEPGYNRFTIEEIEDRIPDRERVHTALIDLIEKNKPYELEYELHPLNGDPLPKVIRSIAELLLDENGVPEKVTGVIQDITEQKRSENEKIKIAKQLKQSQKMEAIGNLAGGIAHDFNNILSAIIGFCQLAQMDLEEDSAIQDDLKEIYMAGNRAKDLVKQILTFSRQSDEEILAVQINPIMREVVSLLNASIPSTIRIDTKIESKSFIRGNPTQLHQVILNLCTNAAYAMEKNGGILTLSLKDIFIENPSELNLNELETGKYIEVVVSDTGEGIPPEIIESIFEPYFTTKPLDEGTGMGLALVHGIVKSYKGSIIAISKMDKGSTFKIYFPIVEMQSPHSTGKIKEFRTGTERILLIDDEISILGLEKRILERMGYSVVAQINSLDALKLFRTTPAEFDLVITDMTMPHMSGDTLAVELLKIRADLPIILCTGYNKNISPESADQIGIKAFIDKPITQADLAKIVRNVLDEAKQF